MRIFDLSTAPGIALMMSLSSSGARVSSAQRHRLSPSQPQHTSSNVSRVMARRLPHPPPTSEGTSNTTRKIKKTEPNSENHRRKPCPAATTYLEECAYVRIHAPSIQICGTLKCICIHTQMYIYIYMYIWVSVSIPTRIGWLGHRYLTFPWTHLIVSQILFLRLTAA